MAKKYLLTSIDLAQNELRNAVVQRLGAAPGTPVEGQVYFDTTKHEFGYYNGTEWKYGGSAVAEATATVLGTVKLAGDIAGGSGAAPQVTGLHLAGDTAINHKLTSVSEPTNAADAATKAYVDGKVSGLAWKVPAQLATAAALPAYTQSGSGPTGTLEANANGALTIDGVAAATKMRVWVKNAVEEKHNGMYEVVQAGGVSEKWKLVRTADANTGAALEDAAAFVREGTANAAKEFVVSDTGTITIETTAVKVVEFQSGAALTGDGVYTERSANTVILKSGTTPSVPGNGEVSSVTAGAARKKTAALTGNGTLTEFTITHSLGTRLLVVQAQEASGGEPSIPVEVDWEPTSANAIKVKFAAALGSGLTVFVTIIG
jgi:hypothetical protein